MFFQRNLPVSLSSCITLSFGEMMTVSSSISLQARAGFFCQVTEAGVLMREGPPRTSYSCGRTSYSRLFQLRHGLGFQATGAWIPVRRRRKVHWAEVCAEWPSGGWAPLGFPPPATVEIFPRPEHSNLIRRP